MLSLYVFTQRIITIDYLTDDSVARPSVVIHIMHHLQTIKEKTGMEREKNLTLVCSL